METNDNIAEKISQILSDPEGMERIKKMAEGIMSDGGNTAVQETLNMPSATDMSAIMNAVNMLKSGNDDRRVKLLVALRPYLSEERKPRLDRAIKLIKLYSVMPLLKDTDIFKF